MVQLLQLVFVAGAAASPALTQFFLMSRHRSYPASNSPVHWNETTLADLVNISTPTPIQGFTKHLINPTSNNTGNVSVNVAHNLENTNIQHAYIISAVLSVLAAVPFLAGHLCNESSLSSNRHNFEVGRRRVRNSRILMFSVVAIFFFSMSAVEESCHQFLFTFLVHEERWSPFAAAWVTAWFWSGMLLVRLVAYMLPARVEDEVSLMLSCAFLPCSLAGLQASIAFSSSDGVWACVFFTGMSLSLIFSTSFTWLHGHLVESAGAASAVVMLSSTLAGVANPLVLGYLLQTGCGSNLPYLLIAEASVALITFLVLYKMSKNLSLTWRGVATNNMEQEICSDTFEEVKEDQGL